jgi:hypothetical protein
MTNKTGKPNTKLLFTAHKRPLIVTGSANRSARSYAGQLADLLEARPLFMENLRQALQTFPGLTLNITGEDIAKYQYVLATQGLSADQQQTFIELGLDARGKEEVLNMMLLAEFPQTVLGSDIVAQFPDLITDPNLIASIQNLAKVTRDYSSGTEWKVFLPLIVC